jgi:Protein of unknown function (DUF4031)
MTVYVYRFEGQRGKLFTQAYPSPWYGLTADTADELHPFAELLGLSSQLYRPVRSDGAETPLVGHYDLSQGERNRAVENGAKPIPTREHKKMLRQQAAAFGIKLD